MHEVRAEMVASVHSILVEVGQAIDAGEILIILESMKMEIPVVVDSAGVVQELGVQVGDVVQEGDLLVIVQPSAGSFGAR
jgi:acetyl-CoA carboxylase biotin carboxyl carrier protein